jgi:hypothetical protein
MTSKNRGKFVLLDMVLKVIVVKLCNRPPGGFAAGGWHRIALLGNRASWDIRMQ